MARAKATVRLFKIEKILTIGLN